MMCFAVLAQSMSVADGRMDGRTTSRQNCHISRREQRTKDDMLNNGTFENYMLDKLIVRELSCM